MPNLILKQDYLNLINHIHQSRRKILKYYLSLYDAMGNRYFKIGVFFQLKYFENEKRKNHNPLFCFFKFRIKFCFFCLLTVSSGDCTILIFLS